jgi:hypothetical protein
MLALYQKHMNCPNNGTEKGADMRSIDRSFYDSKAWKDVQKLYKQKVNGLCELCLEKGYYVPGEIVHHKIHLNADNVNDPAISLNFDNLQLLCKPCHNNIHMKKETQRRWKFIDGELVMTENLPGRDSPLTSK